MNEQDLMSAAARLSAARRRRVQTTCAVCGREMEGTVRRRYCSAACKLRAVRQRHREAAATVTATTGAAGGDAGDCEDLIIELDALRAESSPLDVCVAELIEAAREEQAAAPAAGR